MRLLFPSLIHEFEVTGFKKIQDELIDFIYQDKKNDKLGVVKSNRGGWHSRDFGSDNILVSTVKSEVSKYFLTNRIFREGTIIKFGNIWANINKKGDYNDKHIHPGFDLSGVFWIKIPDDSGTIVFSSPNHYTQFYNETCYTDAIKERFNLSSTYWIKPLEGAIIIFPSVIEHQVDMNMNESNKDRISVSFNLKL